MIIDRRIRQFIDDARHAHASVPNDVMTLSEQRAAADALAEQQFRTVAQAGPEVDDISDHRVAVEGTTMPLRLYRPPLPGPHPIHLLIHGGGWWQGSIDDWICDVQARERCRGAEIAIALAEYRLAPEAKFPTAPNDCLAALRWITAHGTDLGLDVSNLSIGGVSAGANLAAALALMARDQGGPTIAAQVLEVPAVDHQLDHNSVMIHGRDFDITIEVLEQVRDHYFADPADWTHPYAAPLLAPDVIGLPRAHIMTAEFDPLRDGAERYAARLRAAGVTVTGTRHFGMTHTAPAMTAVLEAARTWRAEVISVLADIHHPIHT